MTRNDYNHGKVTHRQYYASVAKAAGIVLDASSEPVQRTLGKYGLQDVTDSFNQVPLACWDRWANERKLEITKALRQHGDAWSLVGGVCTMKAAVREYLDLMKGQS